MGNRLLASRRSRRRTTESFSPIPTVDRKARERLHPFQEKPSFHRTKQRREEIPNCFSQNFTQASPKSPPCSADPCHLLHDSDVGDDEVFMTLELPVDSRSSSGSSSGGSGLSPANHLHRINYVRRETPKEEPLHEPYSYVQFAKHEYSYPLVEALKSSTQRDTAPVPAALPAGTNPNNAAKKAPPLPTKARGGGGGQKRRQCRHCLEEFTEDNNRRGSCEYAPDGVLTCINAASCISCAHCMLYHCMADAEGDFSQRPCSCAGTPRDCRRRWAGLALLSLLVPCLWCYMPLRACHRAAVSCGVCGGRHQV